MEFDELWDATDAEVLTLHRASPAAYQEMQARVQRLHRWFRGLVRLPAEDDSGRAVPGVYVEVPAGDPVAPAEVDRVAEALQECAGRFLSPGDDSSPAVLAELHLPRRRTVRLRFSGDGAAGRLDGVEGDLREVLAHLLAASEEEPDEGRLLPA